MAEQPHETVWRLSTAGFVARCLHLVTDLAAFCSVQADALDRVVRLLAAHGVFEKQDGGYRHTPSSRLLRTDNPRSMRVFSQRPGLQARAGEADIFRPGHDRESRR